MNATVADIDAASLPATSGRLRLKRLFLRSLVLSLTACAFVAVVALLAGSFNKTTARILATLGGLAVHSGFAMACAAALERMRWPKLNVAGLALAGCTFCVLMTTIWWPGWFDEPAGKASLTTVALLAAYLLAIPCADLAERGVLRGPAVLGLAVCAAAFLMTLICIWAEPAEDLTFARLTVVAMIAAFSCSHTALLVRVPGAAMLRWLLPSAIAAVWAVATLASLMILAKIDADFWFRLLGALGVLDFSATLGLLIVAKLQQVGKVEQLQTATPHIELHCPRCTTAQVVAIGATACSACGLKFRIEIEEPRCAKCNYLLWQLPQRRCPECGTPF